MMDDRNRRRRQAGWQGWWLAAAALASVGVTATRGTAELAKFRALVTPQWIWSPEHVAGEVPQASCYFRKTIQLPGEHTGRIRIAADDVYELYVNGKQVAGGSGWKQMAEHDVSSQLRVGKNTVAIKVDNRNGRHAGLVAEILLESRDGQARIYLTNPTWRTSLRVFPLWNSNSYGDVRWLAAQNLGAYGTAQPWVGNGPESSGTAGAPADASLTLVERTLLERTRKAAPPGTEGEGPAEAPGPAQPPGHAKVAEADPTLSDDFPEIALRTGFQIQHVAGSSSTPSLVSMAFNEFGQLLVGQESGPLLLLYDSRGSGAPDEVRVACAQVRNCQGILCLSGRIYVTAEGPEGPGLYRLADTDRDGSFEQVVRLVGFNTGMGTRGAHGVALGPDGLLYISLGAGTRPIGAAAPDRGARRYAGNLLPPQTGVDSGAAEERPRQAENDGVVLRVTLDGSRVDYFAEGLHNGYDLAFGPQGDLFVPDAASPEAGGTPWHRQARLWNVPAAGQLGWRPGWSAWPDYWIDTLPPVMEMGQGDPSGCIFYDHWAFPAKFRNNLFCCDWSAGEIRAYRLDRRGAGLDGHGEIFLRGHPLNITDIDVGPDGALYFCTGGRGTRGDIYRILWTGDIPKAQRDLGAGIERAVRQPQLQSAWGRQAVSAMRQELKEEWDRQLRDYVADARHAGRHRARGLYLMHLVGPPPSDEELLQCARDADESVRATAAYLLGLIDNPATHRRLAELLRDEHAHVRRVAADALARAGQPVPLRSLLAMLRSPDRFEAWSARVLLQQNQTEDWSSVVLASADPRLFALGSTAMLLSPGGLPDEQAQAIAARYRQLTQEFVNDADFVDLLRVLQLLLELGHLPPAQVADLGAALCQEFPAGNIRINRELTRLIVHLQQFEPLGRMLDYLDSDVAAEEKLHVALHLAYLSPGWSPPQRLRLLTALERSDGQALGKELSPHATSAIARVVSAMDPAERAEVLRGADELPRTALTLLFHLPEAQDAENLPIFRDLDQRVAGKKAAAYEALRVGLVAVLARSGDEQAMGYLREVYDSQPARRSTVAMGLAQLPEGRNWDYLVRSIPLLEGEPAREVLRQLQRVPYAPESPEFLRQVILCGLRLGARGGDDAVALLEHWSAERITTSEASWSQQLAAWQAWYEQRYPFQPQATLPVESGTSPWTYDDLLTYLSSAESTHGSVEAGRAVFLKARCAECHAWRDLGQPLGPDLSGIARRLDVREILESLVFPSQVIAAGYPSKTVIRGDGSELSGLVREDTPLGLTLLQPQGRLLNLRRDEVADVLPRASSTMPEGLLNQLQLSEIADLFALLLAEPARVPLPTEATDSMGVARTQTEQVPK